MPPESIALFGRGICLEHRLKDLLSLNETKDCPECWNYRTLEEHKRCATCAINKNKCALCDGPLRK